MVTDTCFLCLGPLRDGTGSVTAGLGFDVHQSCYDGVDGDDDE